MNPIDHLCRHDKNQCLTHYYHINIANRKASCHHIFIDQLQCRGQKKCSGGVTLFFSCFCRARKGKAGLIICNFMTPIFQKKMWWEHLPLCPLPQSTALTHRIASQVSDLLYINIYIVVASNMTLIKILYFSMNKHI